MEIVKQEPGECHVQLWNPGLWVIGNPHRHGNTLLEVLSMLSVVRPRTIDGPVHSIGTGGGEPSSEIRGACGIRCIITLETQLLLIETVDITSLPRLSGYSYNSLETVRH